MRILIAGATGLIGQCWIEHFGAQHTLTLLGRSRAKLQRIFPHHHAITWKELSIEHVRDQDAIINLAGENIGQWWWTASQRAKILQSRVDTTNRLAQLCAELDTPPRLLNASAVGIYGPTSQSVNEHSPLPHPPEDFLSQVGAAWEAALSPALQANVTVIRLRFGVVLSPHGGALAKMLPSFKLGGGAVLGSGTQWMSWINLHDAVAIIEHLLEHPEASGAYNLVAPEVVTQQTFADTLARVLSRPRLLRLPHWMMSTLLGEMGEALLLNSCHVHTNRLEETGYRFKHSTLEQALTKMLIRR